MPKLVISGPAKATTQLTPESPVVSDPDLLATLHGTYSKFLCADHLDDRVMREKIRGGRLRLVFDSRTKQLRITAVYETSEKLDPKTMRHLVDFTVAQWRDVTGSGAFGNHNGNQVLSKHLGMALHHDGVPADELGNLFVDAFAGSSQDVAVEWSDSGSFDDEIIADLHRDAEHGNGDAQIELGNRYLEGYGVEENPDTAFQLFQKAAQSEPLGIAHLGLCYLNGYGTTKDAKRAVQLFEKAAESDVTMAMGFLADCYHEGNGVTKDPKKGLELFLRGAELGDVICEREVGECYELGKGTAIDLEKALAHYERCLEAGVDVRDRVARLRMRVNNPEGANLLNVYCTILDLPALNFPHKLNAKRDRSDPELAEHLNGFIGFVLRGQREMTTPKFHLIQHINKVHHHLALEVADEHLTAFGLWAASANAICFVPDNSVRNPSGAMIMDPFGGTEDADVPFPPEAWRRKQRTDAQLRELQIHSSGGLPPVVSESEVLLRSPREVALRALCLLLMAIRGESLATNNPISVDDLKEKFPAAFEYLTDMELEFMCSKSPAQQQIIDATWKYEALYVLEWGLGLLDDLSLPTKICDVPLVARTALNAGEDLIATARLRPATEILDCLDRHYRLHWVTRQAAFEGCDPPGGLDSGVIRERHRALNWLVRFENADWDDVETPT